MEPGPVAKLADLRRANLAIDSQPHNRKELFMSDSDVPTVVLVHGGFVDGSGWQGVYQHLKQDGYSVSVVQIPTLSHADDVAVTKRAIDAQSEPVILVGH